MNHDSQRGFTLIELLLAMTFISLLLLAIAMTIIQISGIYNRGMTLKEVNQSGRLVSSELAKSINAAMPFSIDETAPDSHIITKDWGGRLCVGQYSYIWNYGSALANGNTVPNLNVYSTGSAKIRFVKVYDANASYCADPTLAISTDGAVELLSTGDHDIVMHNLTLTSSPTANDTATGQRLYDVTFTIGTNTIGGSNDTSSLLPGGTGCKPPNQPGADPIYCVVQTFSFVARAGNMVQ
jgi:prepilin-type N-terminal cleavage/methylation domain-containing protein